MKSHLINSISRTQVVVCLGGFLTTVHRPTLVATGDDPDLLKDLEMESEDGIEFAIILQSTLKVVVPEEFNPFVHESGHRGMRLSELVERLQHFAPVCE